MVDRLKDGLTYKDAFDGREAVDKIAYIIKTTDRNLALLLGRALDAQKFFHDVTYDHRLRDTPNELYQFRTKLPSPFVSGELPNGAENSGDKLASAFVNEVPEVCTRRESVDDHSCSFRRRRMIRLPLHLHPLYLPTHDHAKAQSPMRLSSRLECSPY